MATLKTGWLLNKSGEKFAPKTLLSQVSTDDGILLEQKLETDFSNINTQINDLNEHIEDTDIHITTTERTNWNAAKTHADSVHTIAQGGTGATTAREAQYNLLNDMEKVESGNFTDDACFVGAYTTPDGTKGSIYKSTFSLLLDYIKSKTDSIYAKVSHGNHVPTTETANNSKFLRNDNTWQTVTPKNIGALKQVSNITMANLGFTDNPTVSVEDFLLALKRKVGSNDAQVDFAWNAANSATVSDGTNSININGGVVYTSGHNDILTTTWSNYHALYFHQTSGTFYKFSITVSGEANVYSTSMKVYKSLDALTASDLPTIPIDKGGTGATTAKGAEYAINGGMTAITTDMTDDTQIIMKYTTPDATKGVFIYRAASLLYKYIKSKTDSIYLKLSGGTMTGGITMGTDSSALNDKGITFGETAKIGASTGLGIYSVGNIYLRPGTGALASTDGFSISPTEITPTKNNAMSLGTSSSKWSNVYATTFTGNLTGTASKATADASGNNIEETYAKDSVNVMTKDIGEWKEGTVGLSDTYSYYTISNIEYGNGRYVLMGTFSATNTGGCLYSYSDDGINWNVFDTYQGPAPQAKYLGDKWLGVKPRSYVPNYSYDALTWIPCSGITTIGTSPIFYAYGNGIYLMQYGTTLYYSTDGMSWRDTGFTNTINDCVHIGDKFVAVSGVSIFTSTDGINWTKSTTLGSNNLSKILYANGKLVTYDGYGYIYYSTDGVNWSTGRAGSTTSKTVQLSHLGSGKFMYRYDTSYYISTDLTNWTPSDLSTMIYYLNGKYIRADIERNLKIYYSDMVNKKESVKIECALDNMRSEIPTNYDINNMIDSNMTISAMTKDIDSWKECWDSGNSNTYSLSRVYFNNGKYVAMGSFSNQYTGGPVAWVSEDGINWTSDSSLYSSGSGTMSINGLWFKSTNSGNDINTYYSLDLVNWNLTNLPEGHGGDKVRVYGNGKYLISLYTSSKNLYYSYDGISWVDTGFGLGKDITKCVYGNNIFALTTKEGTVYYSKDCITWTFSKTFGTSSDKFNIVYGNGMFILYNSKGLISRSVDCVVWETIAGSALSIEYYDGMFIRKTTNNIYEKSYDGKRWYTIESFPGGGLPNYANNLYFYSSGSKIYYARSIISRNNIKIEDAIISLHNEIYNTSHFNHNSSNRIPSTTVYIPTTGWVSDTEYSGYGYLFEQSISDYYDEYPEFFLKPATGIVPTSTEKTAFNNIAAMKLDSANKKLKFYAATKPTTNLLVVVKGVK